MIKKLLVLSLFSSTAYAVPTLLIINTNNTVPHCIENYVEYKNQQRTESGPKCWLEKISITVKRCSTVTECYDDEMFYEYECLTSTITPPVDNPTILQYLQQTCKNASEFQDSLYWDYQRLQEQQPTLEDSITNEPTTSREDFPL